MAADINDKLIKQSSGTQPLPTTLSAQKNSGATTASLNAATGWDTTTAKHIRMYKTKVVNGATVPDTNYICYYKGTLSGTTLSNLTLVWSSTGSDQTFALGDTVDLSYTSGWGEDLYSALTAHLDQDGTLKADSVDVTAVIKDGIITNAKLVDDTVEIGKLHEKTSEYLSDFIYSGGVVAQSAGLVGTFSNIVYYIGGVRYTATSVANKTYTASKDTYVDINTSGTVTYTEVANNAASPALSASNIRVAIVTTNGSAITNVNQGQTTQVIPIASSIPYTVTDSLGNLICPRDPSRKLIGYRQITSSFSTGPEADVTGLNVVVNVPDGRKIKVSFYAPQAYNSVDSTRVQQIIHEDGSAIQNGYHRSWTSDNGGSGPVSMSVYRTPSAGTHTYKMRSATLSGTMTLYADATSPAFIAVELV